MQTSQSLRRLLGILVCFIAAAACASGPPTIDYSPRSQEVILYQQVAFGVIASGTLPLAYQWLKDGVSIPDAPTARSRPQSAC
jgi:hypothetical protein